MTYKEYKSSPYKVGEYIKSLAFPRHILRITEMSRFVLTCHVLDLDLNPIKAVSVFYSTIIPFTDDEKIRLL